MGGLGTREDGNERIRWGGKIWLRKIWCRKIEDTKSKVAISCHHRGFQQSNWIAFNCVAGQVGPLKVLNQAVAKTICTLQTDRGTSLPMPQSQSSLKMEKQGQCLHKVFASKFQCLWFRKILCHLPKQKQKHQPIYKIFDLKSVLTARCGEATVALTL